MGLPSVSIITPVRDGRRTILDCVASVAVQRHRGHHIVVDGNSNDGTIDALRGWTRGPLTVESGPDAGVYDAMNKGIRRSDGEVVGILGADDFYASEDVLERVAQEFEDPSVAVCFGDLVYVKQAGNAGATLPADTRLVAHAGRAGKGRSLSLPGEMTVRYWRSGPLLPRSFIRGWMPPHPTFFVRRSSYRECGGYRLDMGSAADYELMLRFLVKHRLRSIYIPEVLVKMRCGGASNRNLRARLQANVQDHRAWMVNGLKPPLTTRVMKPLRKLPQWLRRPPEDPANPQENAESLILGR